MKIFKNIISVLLVAAIAAGALAQNQSQGVRKRSAKERNRQEAEAGPQVSERMQGFYEETPTHDADLAYTRDIYRQIDLQKKENAPLYFPEDVIDGKENLFRLILRLVVEGKIPAYEYLDGREVFTDQYKVNIADMLDRFGIYYTEGAGSTERNPKFVIEEADVPVNQVLNYYIIEKWDFDRRSNQMKTRVVAICPVLNRVGDFGGETRYPMFWVKFDQLRPWLAQQYVFLSDDNNLEQYSLDDFFTMGMYDGDIYKYRNLRNLSMMQMYPDEDDMIAAQDSIDNRLKNFGKDLWVPTREEYLAQREREQELEERRARGENVDAQTVVSEDDNDGATTLNEHKSSSRAKKRPSTTTKRKTTTKAKKPKSSVSSSSSSNSSAQRSVRRRKK